MKFELLTLDKPNKNNRIYPTDIIRREIERLKKELIPSNRFFVTKQLPESDIPDLRNVIGVITDLKIENNVVVGSINFLDVNGGKDIETALLNNQFSIRTSGIGSINKQEDGTYLVGDDYELTGCFVTNKPA